MTELSPTESTAKSDSGVSAVIDTAQRLAANVASNAQDAALRLAEQQKAEAAERVADVARTLDSAADQVERVLPGTAPYIRDAASGIHGVSSTLRDQSIDDLIEMVTDFART